MKFLALLCLLAFNLAAATLLEWYANPETNILGYRVYWGTTSRSYDSILDVGNVTSNVLMVSTGRVYYAVTAYNDELLESDYSDEVFYDWPIPPMPPSRPVHLRFNGTNSVAEVRLLTSAGLTGWMDSGVAFVPITNATTFFQAAAPGFSPESPVKSLRFDGSKKGKLTGSLPAPL